ncbi:hypothetical protein SLH46_01590 [Draconibacterium sp. IB214405]|uniref:hypothetical protein n=1 Tax=Draconibacterium sp. IB214405 TaxID=3097352 RepID=UPI002A130CDF|nr:hypothetical protein [Draconibacterium sp. IB214405]MDX8337855.1 hypothetical protein [Draconibacterium sp. IB214405]
MKNLLKISLFVCFVLFVNISSAQKLMLGLGGGYATFDMSDTRAYNEWVQNNLPFSPALTDDFPGWYYFSGEALYTLPKTVAVGLKMSTTSTGSRLHLSDYSGEYTFDNKQNAWFVGVKTLLGKAPGQKSGPCFSMEAGASFSSMSFEEEIVVYEERESDNEDFSAIGFYVEPGLTYLQNIGKNLIVSGNVSYHMDFGKGYHINGESDMEIIHPETNEKIKPQWNGLRAGIIIYWSL